MILAAMQGLMAANSAPAAGYLSYTTTGVYSVTGTVAANLPSVAAGDLLILSIFLEGNTNVFTPSGWTVLGTTSNRRALFYRIANGSEGASVNVSVGAWTNNGAIAICAKIPASEWNGSVAPQAQIVSGSNDIADPGLLTPSWGALPTIWIAQYSTGVSSGGATSTFPLPDNQVIVENAPTGTSGGGARVFGASCSMVDTVASKNPGNFGDFGPSDTWNAFTIAVRK